MSFFSIQNRTYITDKIPKSQIGPGTYQVDSPTHKQTPSNSYAPFGSTSNKHIKTSSKKQKFQEKVGPGTYEINRDLVKPQVTKYQSKNCIIVKINEQGSCQFKSKDPRFKTTNNFTKESPGPGQYTVEKKRPKTLSNFKRQSKIVEKVKEINRKAYQQQRKPTLFSDEQQQSVSQKPNRPSKPKVQKGIRWSLNKKQRFEPLQKQPFTEAYREEVVNQLKSQKQKNNSKISQSAVFASKSLKSQLQSDMYQSSNPFKVELRKMINYRSDAPGPGAYETRMTIADRTRRLNRHQFFGSTEDRFRSSVSLEQNPIGPGYYDRQKHQTVSKKHVFKRIKTQTQDQKLQLKTQSFLDHRSSYIEDKKSVPGPGTYSVDSTNKNTNEKSNSKKKCSWIFESKKPRMQKIQPQEIFEQDLTQQELNHRIRREREFQYRKQQAMHHKSAVFNSVIERFSQTTKDQENPTIGQYAVTQNDISEKMKKKTEKDISIGRYKKHIEHHPFMSSISRFQYSSAGKQQEHNRKHQNCWCLTKSIEKQIIPHQSPIFADKSDRFGQLYKQTNSSNPFVGYYSKEGTLVKDSFNSRFIKKNEVKTKKMQLWKPKSIVQEEKSVKDVMSLANSMIQKSINLQEVSHKVDDLQEGNQ